MLKGVERSRSILVRAVLAIFCALILMRGYVVARASYLHADLPDV